MPYVPGTTGQAVEAHRYEELLALGENARNTRVGRIVVIVEGGDDQLLRSSVRDVQGASWNRERVDALATDVDLAKLHVHKVDKRPSVADVARFTQEGIVIIANADIVLRDLDRLDATALESDNLALVVSASRPSARYLDGCRRLVEHPYSFRADFFRTKLVDKCAEWEYRGWLWDAIIMASPLQRIPPNLHLDDANAFNLLGNSLAETHSLYNPCHTLRFEEFNCEPSARSLASRIDLDALHNRPGTYVSPETITPGIQC